MKILKGAFALMAVAVAITLAGVHLVYGSGGLNNPWAVNSNARGETGTGDLTMYGQDIDSPACPEPAPGDTRILPRFFLKLTYSRTDYIFSYVSDVTLCHPTEYGEDETLALHQFLKEVLVSIKPAGGYENCTVDPWGTSGAEDICPNILKSIDNIVDTDGQDGPLILMSNVVLKFPK